MRKLFVFMMTSLDGFFEGKNHDLTWHMVDKEFNEFSKEQIGGIDTMLFGRITYELMKNYWPTPEGLKDDPVIANLMNKTPKLVASRTLKSVDWENTTLIKGDLKTEIEKLKAQPGKDIVVFGSSNLCVSLLEMGLLDEVRVIVNPVVLGNGKSLFTGLNKKISFNITGSKTFKNGNVLLYYKPKYEN